MYAYLYCKVEILNKLVRMRSKCLQWAWHSPGERKVEETGIKPEALKGGAL